MNRQTGFRNLARVIFSIRDRYRIALFSLTKKVQFLPELLIACIAILLLVSFVRLAQGTQPIAFPLDDTYIHLQYARQLASGYPLQYNTGALPSSGATSLLYLWVLAGAFRLQLLPHYPSLLLFIGGACYLCTAILLYQSAQILQQRLALPKSWIWLTPAYFLLSGWMLWAFLSGMETALLIALLVLTQWLWLREKPIWAGVFAALTAATRPEFALLAIGLLIAGWLFPNQSAGTHRRLAGAIALLGVLASSFFNWVVTGNVSATGFLSKSWLTLQPFYWQVVWEQSLSTWVGLWTCWLGGFTPDGHWHYLPLTQIPLVLGAVRIGREKSLRGWLVLLGVVLIGLLTATSTLQTATWHHFRYQMPAFPLAVLVSSVGWFVLVNWLCHKIARPQFALRVLWIGIVVWGGLSLMRYQYAYAHDITTVRTMQLPLADWLKTNTPANALVAVHDVGVMRYLGERATLDVVGLTSAGFSAAYRHGPGSLYEVLAIAQPSYFAVYPDLAPPFFGVSAAPKLLGTELFRVQVANFSPYTSAGAQQVISQPDWSSVTLAHYPQQDKIELPLLDSINLADLADEQAHALHWADAVRKAGFASDVRHQAYRLGGVTLADGGRVVNGQIGWMQNAQPHQAFTLVGRFHQEQDTRLQVWVDGQAVGEWRIAAVPGEWQERAFVVPARFVTRPSVEVRWVVTSGQVGLFYLWAFDGTATAPALPTPPAQPVVFSPAAKLIGVSLSATSLQAGDSLSLQTDWQSLSTEAVAWRIFVHLMKPDDDSASGIVAQWDREPSAGVLPFWVWDESAVQSEFITLSLPPDTPAGEYLLLVGVYRADTGERATLTGSADFGNRRYWLSTITVK
jgi:hypothetical protein